MSKRLKIVLLSLLLLAALCPVVIIGLETVRNSRRTTRLLHLYEQGTALMKQNQLDEAKEAFLGCLKIDQHHQDAIVHLAELFELQKQYRQAAHYWARALRLDASSPDYLRQLMHSRLLSRDFAGVLQQLQALSEAERNQPEYAILGIFCELMQGTPELAQKSLGKFREAHPEDTDDMLTFAEAVMGIPQAHELPELQAILTDLAEHSSRLAVQYEALQTLAAIQLRQAEATEDEEERAVGQEKCIQLLTRAAELNPGPGYSSLGARLFQLNREEECARAYEQAETYELSLLDAIYYGEILLRQERISELQALSQKYLRGSRATLQTGYYLEALLAFNDQDLKTMTEKLKNTGAVSRLTSAGVMLNVCAALYQSDWKELARLSADMRQHPQWAGLLPSVRQLCQGALAKAYQERRFAEVAPLAAALPELEAGQPDRLLMGFRLHSSEASPLEYERCLQEILQYDPNDLEALVLCAGFRFRSGQPAQCLELVERALDQPGADRISLYALRSQALAELDRADEGAALWQQLQQSPEGSLASAKYWLLFCLAHASTHPEFLTSFQETIAASQGPEHALLPFPDLVALRHHPPEEIREKAVPGIDALLATKVLDPSQLPDSQLLFQLAMLLGEGDVIPKAIELFQSIQATYPGKLVVTMNLSELHAALGQSAPAMKYAMEAYTANPSDTRALFCYAKRIREQGMWTRLEQLMTPWLEDASCGEQARAFYDEARSHNESASLAAEAMAAMKVKAEAEAKAAAETRAKIEAATRAAAGQAEDAAPDK